MEWPWPATVNLVTPTATVSFLSPDQEMETWSGENGVKPHHETCAIRMIKDHNDFPTPGFKTALTGSIPISQNV